MSDAFPKPCPSGGTFVALRFCEVLPLGFAPAWLGQPATLVAAIPAVIQVAGLLEPTAADCGATVH
jgi:hypothetical protein